MMQLLEIYHASQKGCIFFGNMYNDLRDAMKGPFYWDIGEHMTLKPVAFL